MDPCYWLFAGIVGQGCVIFLHDTDSRHYRVGGNLSTCGLVHTVRIRNDESNKFIIFLQGWYFGELLCRGDYGPG